MSEPAALPRGVLIAFYGDDFTGSAAVMEALSFAGLPTVLFLSPPPPEQIARFPEARAIGIAGVARSQTPEWMERELPPIYDALAALGAPIVQYKICSTLDSSPNLGSIGKAAELGMAKFPGAWTPLLAAAPSMGRYQAFGNFYARFDGAIHRLDRHPVMSRHPSTPIDEADIRLHVGRQTKMPVGLIDIAMLASGEAKRALQRAMSQSRLIALDALDEDSLREAGRLIWENRANPLFTIGSQGIEYALLAHWRAIGALAAPPPSKNAGEVAQIAVASGSCSPVTERQIAWAREREFRLVPVDAARAVDAAAWRAELARAGEAALAALSEGRSALLYTALGPDDPAIAALRAACRASGQAEGAVTERIGAGLGGAVESIARRANLRRVAVAGGDTSSHALMAMQIDALTALAPVCPGGALLQAHAGAPSLEIALKGGQMGEDDYFGLVRAGGVA